ncbi:putative DNA helicase [Candidatus Vecturithrix granuli]|uniref:DNA 3'-5' helicase n=1 Tax=Vecturithrix granuli TaxID=1499967 RepID=A0A081C2W8_VECG1|nr:putative DNA helicase [Candidatus Vecturithrix granuli]
MKPTDEQQAILKAGGRVVRINARAGTGKTTTLKMLADRYRNQRILYLVFNRKAREAAQAAFPSNVDALTVHALAYRREGYKWRDTLGHFSPADMLAAFGKKEQVLATLSHDFLIFFLNSEYDKLEDAVRPFLKELPERLRDLFQYDQPRLIQAARQIATAWNTRQKACPHDFYLKLCHKSGNLQAALNRYDLLLIDEAQDLSPVMLDALRTCRKRLILVGDSHQQIYSFRYAIDAMQKIACDEEFDLSLSFRFGDSIAELASIFIQEAKQEPQFCIRGNRHANSTVALYCQIHAAKRSTTAVLSRSNVALFENAVHFRSRAVPFTFERDIYPLLMRTLDVYWLATYQPEQIRDPLLRSFKHVEDLETYARDTDNFQLQGMLDIVERYAEQFPEIIFELQPLTQFGKDRITKKGVILSTIHSAKGQEYDQVYIDADMAENLDVVMKNDLEGMTDEINVAYVGFTRAKHHLHLPLEIQSVLTPRWNKYLEQYRAPDKHYQPGDRVFTELGPGTLLESDGSYCLVNIAARDAIARLRVEQIR